MTTEETKPTDVKEKDAARPTTTGAAPPPSPATATTTWQWAVRQRVAPFLPPPVTRGMQRWDVVLEPYVGPEATVTLASSLLVAWLVLWLLRSFMLVVNRTGRAIADDDDAVGAEVAGKGEAVVRRSEYGVGVGRFLAVGVSIASTGFWRERRGGRYTRVFREA